MTALMTVMEHLVIMTKKDRNRVDIRQFVCPMTSVHLRVALDRLPSGALLDVWLRGDETLKNATAMLASLHQELVETRPTPHDATIDSLPAHPDYILTIRKN